VKSEKGRGKREEGRGKGIDTFFFSLRVVTNAWHTFKPIGLASNNW